MKRSLTVISLCSAAMVVLALVVVTGCGSSGSSTADDSKSLEGKTWKATEIAGVKSVLTTPGSTATAKFAAGRIAGSATINTYSGSYTTGPGNTMQIGSLMNTQMAGPADAMAQEQAYLAALQKAATYKVTSDSLTLLDSKGATLVKYAVAVDTPLTNTKWHATGYNNGKGALQSLAANTLITAVFGTNGDLAGNATINQYSTKYTSSADGKMTIDAQIISTKMAGSAEAMAQEAAYLAALPKTASYEIDGDVLTLRDASGAALATYTTP
jgi:heat shock protein HslJ